MTDPLERDLAPLLRLVPAASEPDAAFRDRILEQTIGALPRPRWRPGATVALWAAGVLAILGAAVWFATRTRVFAPPLPFDPVAHVGVPDSIGARTELFDQLYDDPVVYLARRGVDTSIAGLMRAHAAFASGARTDVEAGAYACLDALVARLGRRATPLLVARLDAAPSDDIVRLLGRIGDATALPALERLVASGPDARIVGAVGAIATIAGRRPGLVPGVRARLAAGAWLVPGTERYNPHTAAALLGALVALGDPDAAHDATRLLEAAPHPALLAVAAEAPPRVIDRLVASHPDDDALVEWLARRRDPRALPLVERMLASTSWSIRVDGARAAGRYARADALAPLADALARVEEDEERPVLLWARARCGDRDAPAAILDAMRGTSNYRTFDWSVDALLDLGVDGASLVRALPDGAFVLDGLARILAARSDAAAAVDARLDGMPDGVARRALELVRDLGATDATRDYLRFVADAGGRLGDYLALRDVAAVLARLRAPNADAHDSMCAVRALRIVRGQPDERARVATRALSEPDPRVRREAIAVLVGIDTPAARAALLAHDDRDPRLAARIVDALGRTDVDPRDAQVARIAAYHRARRGDVDARDRLRREARSDDVATAYPAQDLLVALGDPAVVGVWLDALASDDHGRRVVALGWLRATTGQSLPEDADAWRTWWAAHADGVRLVRPSPPRPAPSPSRPFEPRELR